MQGTEKHTHLGQVSKANGLSYIEVLLALTLFAVSASSLLQLNLVQAQVSQTLNQRWLSLHLITVTAAKLRNNRDYILEQGENALYFANELGALPCEPGWITSCHQSPCSSTELAQTDLEELNCLAQQANVKVSLQLVSAEPNKPIAVIEIALTENRDCQQHGCFEQRQPLYL